MKYRRTMLTLAAALLLLVASAFQGRQLMSRRQSRGAVELKDAPPSITFISVALGGFKGILADILWLRASLLQEEGRYLELVQLSDWITKLEPGIAEIWSFHAWNMAYNVSVMMPKPEDRWRWVLNGLELLRDHGIAYNPNDPKLYFDLAWLFQHKLGQNMDAMHLYYKRAWASRMSKFTGADGYMDYDNVTQDARKELSREFKMDLDLMRELDKRYGPLDWRIPEAHSAYWGYKGTKVAGDKGYIACDRAVYQSIMILFRRGKLDFDEESGSYDISFNPQLLNSAIKAYEDTMDRYPGGRTVRDSYSIFLREAVLRLHGSGLEREARELFKRLAEDYGNTDTEDGYESFVKRDHDEVYHAK